MLIQFLVDGLLLVALCVLVVIQSVLSVLFWCAIFHWFTGCDDRWQRLAPMTPVHINEQLTYRAVTHTAAQTATVYAAQVASTQPGANR